MQPIKLTIPGEFWDSQIYSNRLLLFGSAGAVWTLEWASYVSYLASCRPDVQTALRLAFCDGELLYEPRFMEVLSDPEISRVIIRQLQSLATTGHEVDGDDLNLFSSVSNSPFDFVPTDTDVYRSRLFASGDNGLYSSPFKSTERAAHVAKHHDGPVLQVKASPGHSTIAMAAGSDGLMELPVFGRYNARAQPFTLTDKSCNACEWAFHNVIGWNPAEAFLVSMGEEYGEEETGQERHRYVETVQGFDEIFDTRSVQAGGDGGRSIAWGSQEKMYMITDRGFMVQDFFPSALKKGRTRNKRRAKSELRGLHDVHVPIDEVVSTGTAHFGAVIELNDKLIVYRSDDRMEVFDEEPVHWRVFPRSRLYSNQLHIVYEDRIEIVAFVHDYFVKQGEKLMGTRFGDRSDSRRGGIKGWNETISEATRGISEDDVNFPF